VLSSGGFGLTLSGGMTTGTLVSNGGVEHVLGVVSQTVVLGGGQEFVFSGGIANGTVLSNGGFGIIDTGATAVATVVSSGGQQNVNGVASRAVVSSGGFDVILSGGETFATVVSSGGQETVTSGGIASGAVVNSGGLEFVSSGGTVLSATISGGVVEVGSNGVLSGVVTFASSGGGTLQLDGAQSYASAFVFGFTSSDFIDFRAVAFSGSVLSWNQINTSSGTLSVTNGGTSASITLLGQYIASQFTSANDGHGGTLVGDPPVVGQADLLANPHST
jgi:autotransporter passenger strand-loop-strand repeat protein